MDLDTENMIAGMLLKEAAELRRQAEQEGVLAYLKKPTVRVRPNSRFLTSTVRGVEQANRAVEVNEMWRARQKEIELDSRSKGSVDRDSSTHRNHRHEPSNRHRDNPSSSTRNGNSDRYRTDDEELRDDEGLKDDELEVFLRSRVKRGRGSIGSRMDEMGPYVSQSSDPLFVSSDHAKEERWRRVAFGPDKLSWKSKDSSDEDDDASEDDRDRKKKSKKSSSKKHHTSKKHKSKEKTLDKKRKKSRHDKRYNK